MKKTCLSDFYLIGFPICGNYCSFSRLIDFVCHVDIHEPLEEQQAMAIVTQLEVLAVARFIRLN